MQELADQLGTSKVTIFEPRRRAGKKRVLRRDKHKARSLENRHEEAPRRRPRDQAPLLGNIAAGSPIEAVENREELDLERCSTPRTACTSCASAATA
jgi:SOS-response transcriptional repressor LexA